MVRIVKVLVAATVVAGVLPVAGSAQKKLLDPIGTYTVSTMSDTGTAMTGTLTIAATADGNYTGQFTAPAIPAPVPIGSVAVNGNEVLVVLRTSANTLALVYVERTADGTFKGTWHKLSDGIPATVTRAK